MQNLAKKKTTFSRDIPFISTCFIVNTSRCKILQKRKRLFRKIFHLSVCVSILILVNVQSCQKENGSFARYYISFFLNRIFIPYFVCSIFFPESKDVLTVTQ